MIFNEALYPIFLFISVLVFHIVPKNFKPWWIFICGTTFYAYYADVFIFLFIIETIVVYVLLRQFRQNLFAFIFTLIFSIGILIYFKYRNMVLISVFSVLDTFQSGELPTFDRFILPLAISFFTFEFIHYIVDVYKGKIKPHNFKEFLAFIMFFPTMVAGPIKRFQDFVPKMENATFSFKDLSSGITRIIIGLAKKIIIADSMDLWIQPIQSITGIAGADSYTLWIALFAYGIKIYSDFSGYSDIAIGSARLFGITIPENFAYPYFQANIRRFWRCWHISLTKWIIDYIYIPLGGSKCSFKRTAFNILAAMSISGIWHGAAWHFVLWGLYHGFLLALNSFYRQKIKPHIAWIDKFSIVINPISTVFTFILVTFGWALFVMPIENFKNALPKLLFLAGW